MSATPSATAARERSLRLKVGALIVVAIILAVGFVAILGNFSIGGGFKVKVDFDFSGNLQPGAPVKISGIKVGKVDDVQFLGGRFDEEAKRRVQVRMVLWIEDRAREAIRENAEFYINTQGVLGEQYLEISPGDFARPAIVAGSVRRGVDPPRTDLIVSRLYEFLDSITTLLRDDKEVIRDFLKSGTSMVRTLDVLLRENRDSISRLLNNVDRFTADAENLLASLRKGLGDAGQIKRTLGNIEALSASIRQDIDPLIAKAKKALDGLENVTSVVGPGEKKKLIQALDELVSLSGRVDAVSGDVQEIVGNLKKGKGTAGALLVDQQMYDDLKELVRDLKRNPWKFFWKE